MKKLLVLFIALLIGTGAFAVGSVTILTGVNLENYWNKKDIDEEKLLSVGEKILYMNKINRRVPIILANSPNIINAYSFSYLKTVKISSGIMPYFDTDDELAAILSHEIAHSMEAYGGLLKITSMTFNSKKYEYKADLTGIDYMVKAGYNPIAALIIINKITDEPLWDWGFTSTHPKGSKRLVAMYEYIYIKYPKYLNSDMTKNVTYQNFLYAHEDEIQKIKQDKKIRAQLQNEDI